MSLEHSQMVLSETTKSIILAGPNIPVIVMSGYSETFSVDEAMRRGASEYILKPFKKEEINMILNNTPEDIPESILDHLKNLLSSWGINVIHTHNLNKILREDKEVLEKPAR